jgi:hypothetical protein
MRGASTSAVQMVVGLAVLTVMILVGLKKRVLEPRVAPARRMRVRRWRRMLRR